MVLYSHDFPTPLQRWPLDRLLRRLTEPGFASRFRRRHTFRETSNHVNPLMLAVSSPDSLYVVEWRRHAASCQACRSLFVYFGLL